MAVLAASVVLDEALAQQGPFVVPQPAFINQSVSNSAGVNDFNTNNGGLIDDGFARAEGLYTGNDGSASIAIQSGFNGMVHAEAEAYWTFTIVPPSGVSLDTPVPIVLVSASKLVIQGVTAGNFVNVEERFDSNASGIGFDDLTYSGNTYFQVPEHAQAATVLPLSTYFINMAVIADLITGSLDGEPFGDTTAFVEASIDPVVEFDPDFDSQGYSLVSSPVSSDESPVASQIPEPSTDWILFAGGLGLLLGRKSGSRRRPPSSSTSADRWSAVKRWGIRVGKSCPSSMERSAVQ